MQFLEQHMYMLLQARSAEVIRLSQESTDLIERLEAAEAAADKYEGRYRAAKASLQESEASCGQQAAELRHLSDAFSTEQATAGSAREAVETLATRLTAVQVRMLVCVANCLMFRQAWLLNCGCVC